LRTILFANGMLCQARPPSAWAYVATRERPRAYQLRLGARGRAGRRTGFQDHWVKSWPVKSLRVCGGGRITMRSTVRRGAHNQPSVKPARPLNIGFDCSSSQFIRLYLPLSAWGPFRQLNCRHFLASGSRLLVDRGHVSPTGLEASVVFDAPVVAVMIWFLDRFYKPIVSRGRQWEPMGGQPGTNSTALSAWSPVPASSMSVHVTNRAGIGAGR
jgi:hypothetical protein